MADVDVEGAQPESKPKRKPPKPKGGGGGMATTVASVVAVAAIIMCVLLFMQLQSFRKQLGEAGIEKPAGLGGSALAAENGEGAGPGAGGTNHYDWQDDPRTGIIYPLGEFTANTADGKYAKMALSLELSSGISSHDRQAYQVLQWSYEMELEKYNEALEKWKKDNKISSAVPWLAPVPPSQSQFVCAGLILLQHGAPAEAAGPPEMPQPPEEPRTVLEQELDELSPQIRELIIDKINAATADELTSAAGKDMFKQAVVDGINGLIQPYNGLVTGLIISEKIVTY